MKKCPKCGEDSLPDSIKFCYKCNYNFYPQKRTPQPPISKPVRDTERKTSTPVIIGGLSIVTIIVFLAVIVTEAIIF
jgi:uncharacterized membrane protein YvbJ